MDIIHHAMLCPETYPEREAPIDYVETHVSRLYFTSRHVYKIKKPVDFGFLNFTTLDHRRFYCREEIRLNQRFAPGTYLGVVDIRRTPSGIRIADQGEIIEHAVWMRRLPAELMLDRRIAAGDPDLPPVMDSLGHRLAELHAKSEVCRNDGGRPNVDVVRSNWRENFDQTTPFAGKTLSPQAIALIAGYVGRFLERHASLLRRRETEGHVRDGHGDLHAEHICLTDPVQIYDCIEFNRRFRIADTAADLSFLLMDLEYRRRRDLAGRVLTAYREGRRDRTEMDLLLPFYKLYRAFVRGKVNSFLTADESASQATRSAAEAEAARYFNLALGYLCGQVLVLTSGLMGTGKSTLAAALAAPLGADLLRSDTLRKEIAGARGGEGRTADFGTGIYSPAFTRRTYDRLLERTTETLAAGRSVVADASFLRREERELFRAAAGAAGVPLVLALTECPRDTALQRLDARLDAGGDPSDGRRELYDLQAATLDPAAPIENAIRVDTARPVDYNVDLLLCEIIDKAGT
jgi:aminoglycoside phosphotransferase family enzyme/predicted kinase